MQSNNLLRPISTKKTLAPLAPTQNTNTAPSVTAANSSFFFKSNAHKHETIQEHE